jgi:ADP-heptose:LPS heptosyltransferase
VGNDTGPMHLIAAAGAPSVCLFSADSDPALCAPRGAVTVLREPNLADLAVAAVLDAAVTRMAIHGR